MAEEVASTAPVELKLENSVLRFEKLFSGSESTPPDPKGQKV